MLDSLVGSLRPGGWVVIEDFDNMFLDVGLATTSEQAVVRKVALAFKQLLQDRGADLAYARLPPLTERDRRAEAPLEAFDFTQAPRAPVGLP